MLINTGIAVSTQDPAVPARGFGCGGTSLGRGGSGKDSTPGSARGEEGRERLQQGRMGKQVSPGGASVPFPLAFLLSLEPGLGSARLQ